MFMQQAYNITTCIECSIITKVTAKQSWGQGSSHDKLCRMHRHGRIGSNALTVTFPKQSFCNKTIVWHWVCKQAVVRGSRRIYSPLPTLQHKSLAINIWDGFWGLFCARRCLTGFWFNSGLHTTTRTQQLFQSVHLHRRRTIRTSAIRQEIYIYIYIDRSTITGLV